MIHAETARRHVGRGHLLSLRSRYRYSVRSADTGNII